MRVRILALAIGATIALSCHRVGTPSVRLAGTPPVVIVVGCVIDTTDASPVAFSRVRLLRGRDSAVTDSTGFFRLATAPGARRDTLELRALGYGHNYFPLAVPQAGTVVLERVAAYVNAIVDYAPFPDSATTARREAWKARWPVLIAQCQQSLATLRRTGSLTPVDADKRG